MAISLAALGVNVKRLYQGQPPVAGATLYTAPGATTARTQLGACVICNPSPSAVPVRLGVVPSGGTADGTHYVLGDQSIPANSSLLLDLGQYLSPGDLLEGQSGSLPAPTNPVATGSTTGGTIAAGTYFFVITGTNANGETVASTESTGVVTTGSTSSITLTWSRLLGVTGYKIYGSAATGTETLLTQGTISGGATVTATITAMTAAAGPVSPPTTGTAAGCIFTISGAEIPA